MCVCAMMPPVNASTRLGLLVTVSLAVPACGPPPDPAAPLAPTALFEDATERVGLAGFRHFNGMSGRRYIAEMMGTGGAFFDYDGDGDLDLWLRQGILMGEDVAPEEALFPLPDEPGDRLFRNELSESGALTFTDVTASIGISVADYAMGIAAADYDGDARPDLYLTNFGENRLLRNLGDGRFEDVTVRAGAGDHRWSVPAVFADLDGDGLTDLWVGNYVDFGYGNHRTCLRPSSATDYCGPMSFRPQPDRMFRNRGDGTFEDVTAQAGFATAYGSALGVLAQDFDGDGRLDLFVANDAMENHLWLNRGGGKFEEDGLLRGVAVNARGQREGSMGVSVGDPDGDGDPDVFVTHMSTETNTLYLNDGGLFRDGTLAAGLARPSLPFTGFGTSWIDLDLDGRLDLFVANGEVKVIEQLERAGDPFPLHQTNQLFRNLGEGRFEEVTDRGGPAFADSSVSRGAIFGDVDNDGDVDVLVANNNGRVQLLLSSAATADNWVGVAGPTQGSRVALVFGDGSSLVRYAGTDGSYCAANDPRVVFGVPPGARPVGVRVTWPGGATERFELHSRGRYETCVRGSGSPDS